MTKKQKAIIAILLFIAFIKERGFLMYGLTSKEHLKDIIKSVVSVFGGGENAEKLLWETAGAETARGDTPDLTLHSGYGIMQFDNAGFEEVKRRTRQSVKEKIKQAFGIDIDRVTIQELQHSPLLSVIFARLYYMLIPKPIPDNIVGRAEYWKKYYNTYAGSGTVEHYLSANLEGTKI